MSSNSAVRHDQPSPSLFQKVPSAAEVAIIMITTIAQGAICAGLAIAVLNTQVGLSLGIGISIGALVGISLIGIRILVTKCRQTPPENLSNRTVTLLNPQKAERKRSLSAPPGTPIRPPVKPPEKRELSPANEETKNIPEVAEPEDTILNENEVETEVTSNPKVSMQAVFTQAINAPYTPPEVIPNNINADEPNSMQITENQHTEIRTVIEPPIPQPPDTAHRKQRSTRSVKSKSVTNSENGKSAESSTQRPRSKSTSTRVISLEMAKVLAAAIKIEALKLPDPKPGALPQIAPIPAQLVEPIAPAVKVLAPRVEEAQVEVSLTFEQQLVEFQNMTEGLNNQLAAIYKDYPIVEAIINSAVAEITVNTENLIHNVLAEAVDHTADMVMNNLLNVVEKSLTVVMGKAAKPAAAFILNRVALSSLIDPLNPAAPLAILDLPLKFFMLNELLSNWIKGKFADKENELDRFFEQILDKGLDKAQNLLPQSDGLIVNTITEFVHDMALNAYDDLKAVCKEKLMEKVFEGLNQLDQIMKNEENGKFINYFYGISTYLLTEGKTQNTFVGTMFKTTILQPLAVVAEGAQALGAPANATKSLILNELSDYVQHANCFEAQVIRHCYQAALGVTGVIGAVGGSVAKRAVQTAVNFTVKPMIGKLAKDVGQAVGNSLSLVQLVEMPQKVVISDYQIAIAEHSFLYHLKDFIDVRGSECVDLADQKLAQFMHNRVLGLREMALEKLKIHLGRYLRRHNIDWKDPEVEDADALERIFEPGDNFDLDQSIETMINLITSDVKRVTEAILDAREKLQDEKAEKVAAEKVAAEEPKVEAIQANEVQPGLMQKALGAAFSAFTAVRQVGGELANNGIDNALEDAPDYVREWLTENVRVLVADFKSKLKTETLPSLSDAVQAKIREKGQQIRTIETGLGVDELKQIHITFPDAMTLLIQHKLQIGIQKGSIDVVALALTNGDEDKARKYLAKYDPTFVEKVMDLWNLFAS